MAGRDDAFHSDSSSSTAVGSGAGARAGGLVTAPKEMADSRGGENNTSTGKSTRTGPGAPELAV
jgi:hypothetical protein